MDDHRIRTMMQAATSELAVPDHLWSEILARARRRNRRVAAAWLLPAAVAVGVFLLTAVPGVRAWAAQTLPMVGTFLERWSQLESGWAWAADHDGFQEVLAERYDNGYTFRVHRVLADPTHTTLIFTVEGKNPGWIDATPIFNGDRRFSNTQGGRHELMDGVLVGSLEIAALPEEAGELELQVRRIGQTRGRWDVTFPITRAALTAETRIIPVGETIHIPGGGGELAVEELLLAPTQVALRLKHRGSLLAPAALEATATSPNGPLTFRGAGGWGLEERNSPWTLRYQLDFQPQDPIPHRITFHLAGQVYQEGETRLTLAEGNTARTPGGHEVVLERIKVTGQTGVATIGAPGGSVRNPDPLWALNWMVVDDAGECHLTHLAESWIGGLPPQNENDPGSLVARTTVDWKLPAGRRPVALVVAGYWEYVEDLGDVTVEIPQQ